MLERKIVEAIEHELRCYQERLINRQPLLDEEDNIRNAWQDGSIIIFEGKASHVSKQVENKAVKLAMMSKQREDADLSVQIISKMQDILTDRQRELLTYRYFKQHSVDCICYSDMHISVSQYKIIRLELLERFARAFGWIA